MTWLAWILALAPALDDNDGLHSAIAAAGDVNGDGVPDVLVATRPEVVEGATTGKGDPATSRRIAWSRAGSDAS